MALTGVVLAGGRSSRMGRDKALIEVDGTALAVGVTLTLAAAGCEPVWCQGGDAERLTALGLEVLADSAPGEGPVVALADALAVALAGPATQAVVCACDLPWLDPETITRLVMTASEHPEAPVVVAVDGDDRPHLVAVWQGDSAAQLAELSASGVRKYRDALDLLEAVTVTVDAATVRNVNTPDDLPNGR